MHLGMRGKNTTLIAGERESEISFLLVAFVALFVLLDTRLG